MFDGDDFPSAPIHTGGCVPRYFCECHTYIASQDEPSASQSPWDEASEPGRHLGGPLPGIKHNYSRENMLKKRYMELYTYPSASRVSHM